MSKQYTPQEMADYDLVIGLACIVGLHQVHDGQFAVPSAVVNEGILHIDAGAVAEYLTALDEEHRVADVHFRTVQDAIDLKQAAYDRYVG